MEHVETVRYQTVGGGAEENREAISEWFDKEFQTCLIEKIARMSLPDEKEWDSLGLLEKNQLRMGIIMGGFSEWYRQQGISQRFTKDLEKFSEISKLHKKHGVSMAINDAEKESRRFEMQKDFSVFTEGIPEEWEASHLPEGITQH